MTRALAGLLLALALAGCRPPGAEGDLGVRLETTPDPPTVGMTRLALELSRAGEPLEGASVSVEGNMTHAGMSPVRAEAVELGGGRYEVEGLDLNMAGDWVLTVSATEGGETLNADEPLRVAEP